MVLGIGKRTEGKGHPHPTLRPGHSPAHCQLTSAPAGGEAAENHHTHVQPLLDPDLAHDANHLQGEHVLTKVIPTLEEGRE